MTKGLASSTPSEGQRTRQAATCGPECRRARRARRTLPSRSFVMHEFRVLGYPPLIAKFCLFHHKIMNPSIYGHYPGFCKKPVCCVLFLYLVVQNMTKWESLTEKSGEKSKNEVEKMEKSPAHTLKYSENGEKSLGFSPFSPFCVTLSTHEKKWRKWSYSKPFSPHFSSTSYSIHTVITV